MSICIFYCREGRSQCEKSLETKQGSISECVLRVLPAAMTVSERTEHHCGLTFPAVLTKVLKEVT